LGVGALGRPGLHELRSRGSRLFYLGRSRLRTHWLRTYWRNPPDGNRQARFGSESAATDLGPRESLSGGLREHAHPGDAQSDVDDGGAHFPGSREHTQGPEIMIYRFLKVTQGINRVEDLR